MACEIQISDDDGNLQITGNRCGRGYQFVQKHLDEEQRIVTGRCLLSGGQMSRLPVSTNKKVPGSQVSDILEVIQNTRVQAPIKRGQVIIENILGTGADVIAQRKAL
jgi:CxxC motif-containing protein